MELKQMGSLAWLHSVDGIAIAPSSPTRAQSIRDGASGFFFVVCQLIPRLGTAAADAAGTWPNWPATGKLRAKLHVTWARQL
eukprot:2319755-Pyramimonas_sp.AAC.2